MFTVIKLGGVNGSGKTSIARSLLQDHLGDIIAGEVGLVSGKRGRVYKGSYSGIPVTVLGNYESVCGGMDTISDKHDRLGLLKDFCQGNSIVFYEGLITGKTYGAMGALSEAHITKGAGNWLYAFMDTPFDECVRRVEQRRRDKGNSAPFDPERTMRATYKSCVTLEAKLRDGRLFPHPTHAINHTQPPIAAARELLEEALSIHVTKGK